MAAVNTLTLIIAIFGVAVSKTLSSESLQLQLLDKHQTVLLDLQSQYDIMMQRQLDMKELVSEVVRTNTKLQLRNEELEVRLQIIENVLREFTLQQDEGEISVPEDVGNTEAELLADNGFNEDSVASEDCENRLAAVKDILLEKENDRQTAVNELTNLVESYEHYFKRVCVPSGLQILTENKAPALSDFIGNREAEMIEYKRTSTGETRQNVHVSQDDTSSYESVFLKLNEKLETLTGRLNELEMSRSNIKELKGNKDEIPNGRVRRNTLSAQSVFSVAMTDQLDGGVYEKIVIFDKIFTNLGGNLVTSNTTFITPVPGYYYFVFTLRSLDNKYIGVSLMKNLDHQTSIYTDSGDRNVMQSQSIVLQLAAGDMVWLRLGPSQQYAIHSDDYNYCTFNGFILNEIV